MILRLLLLSLLMAPLPALAQGAMEENEEELRDAPVAPAFRGVLPARADLSARLPRPRNQGPTGTCVGWAVAYAAASAFHRARGGVQADFALSPAFLYNQISGDNSCRQGTRVSQALETMRTIGALPISEFAFDAGWCGRQPTPAELARAQRWRIAGWARLVPHDAATVKGQVARGMPVIFSMPIGPVFQGHRGGGVFSADDAGARTSHAMVIVGYDDARGAFRIVNSWGADWGEDGFAWLDYGLLARRLENAFVIQ